MHTSSSHHQRGSYVPRHSRECSSMATVRHRPSPLPCPALLWGATVAGSAHHPLPLACSQVGRHFQLKAPFLGVSSVAVPCSCWGRRHLWEPWWWVPLADEHGRSRALPPDVGAVGAVLGCPGPSWAAGGWWLPRARLQNCHQPLPLGWHSGAGGDRHPPPRKNSIWSTNPGKRS